MGCRRWTCHRTEHCAAVACPSISSLRVAVPSSQGYIGRKQPTKVCLSNPVSAGAATEDCHVLMSVGVQTWRQDAKSRTGERDSNFTLPYLQLAVKVGFSLQDLPGGSGIGTVL